MGLCSDQVVTSEIFNQESEHCCIIGEKALHFPFQLSKINNIFQFINISYGWLEKVYKDKFYIFSIFKQQMGLISILISLQYNLFPSGSSIFLGVNRIKCLSWEEEKTKNCLEWINHESYCLLPSRTDSHYFYYPISILMDEFCNKHVQPWHDFISHFPNLFVNLKHQV